MFLAKHKNVFLAETQNCVSGLVVYKMDLDTATKTYLFHAYLWCVREFMPTVCACGCLDRVSQNGHYRKDCRRRITAAGGVVPHNVRSACKKRYDIKHNPKKNPKSNKKKKLAPPICKQCKTTRASTKPSKCPLVRVHLWLTGLT